MSIRFKLQRRTLIVAVLAFTFTYIFFTLASSSLETASPAPLAPANTPSVAQPKDVQKDKPVTPESTDSDNDKIENIETLYDSAKIADKINPGTVTKDSKISPVTLPDPSGPASLADAVDKKPTNAADPVKEKPKQGENPKAGVKKTPLLNVNSIKDSISTIQNQMLKSTFLSPPEEVKKASHLVIVPGHAIFMPRPALNLPDGGLEDHNTHRNERNEEERPDSMEMPRDSPNNQQSRNNGKVKRAAIPEAEGNPSSATTTNPTDNNEDKKSAIKRSPVDIEAEQLAKIDGTGGTGGTYTQNGMQNPASSKNFVDDKLAKTLEQTQMMDGKVAQGISAKNAEKPVGSKELNGKIRETMDDDLDFMKTNMDNIEYTDSALTTPPTSTGLMTKFNVFSNVRNQVDGKDEANWMISSFQKGQTQTFLKHIRVAARIARKDPNAVLVFSGGQTQQFAGPYSESQSYWALAASVLHEYDVPDLSFNDDKSDSTQDKNKVSGGRNYGDHLVNRMIVEEYATDSYENLLFSIARFHEYTGNYPELVTVVGLDFKKERFQRIHRSAIHFPAPKFRYVGIDPPELMESSKDGNRDQVVDGSDYNPSDNDDILNFEDSAQKINAAIAAKNNKSPRYIQALIGERKNALEPFARDPYGCSDPILVEKRRARNPFRRFHPYMVSCPELFDLFTICVNKVDEKWFETLPWNKKH